MHTNADFVMPFVAYAERSQKIVVLFYNCVLP